MRKIFCGLFLLISATGISQQAILVNFSAKQSSQPLDGRLLLLLSKNNRQEPRFRINDDAGTQQAFGVDVENWQPAESKRFTAKEWGYPIQSLQQLQPGDYYVQALLHRYETFHRKDGHVVKLPMDRGEGQQWNLAPGNLYSKPVKLHIDAEEYHSPRIERSDSTHKRTGRYKIY
jgi:hypothetical protein